MTNVFSEKQLEAYLAGSLDGETRAAVELALESDDELAQRLQSLDHPP